MAAILAAPTNGDSSQLRKLFPEIAWHYKQAQYRRKMHPEQGLQDEVAPDRDIGLSWKRVINTRLVNHRKTIQDQHKRIDELTKRVEQLETQLAQQGKVLDGVQRRTEDLDAIESHVNDLHKRVAKLEPRSTTKLWTAIDDAPERGVFVDDEGDSWLLVWLNRRAYMRWWNPARRDWMDDCVPWHEVAHRHGPLRRKEDVEGAQ